MEKIAEVLERKFPQFNTVTGECLVSDALYQMCCENVDFLIVMEEDRFQGVISDHDIASKVLFASQPLNRIHVKEFMNRTLPVASSDNSVQYGLQLIEKYHAGHVAIFDDFDFKGVLSARDLSQQLNVSGQSKDAWDVAQEYGWNF